MNDDTLQRWRTAPASLCVSFKASHSLSRDMKRGFHFSLIRVALASGKTKKDDTMKRLLAFFATTMALVITPEAKADGGVFTVKQYNLTHEIKSISAAESAMNHSDIWANSPVTKLSQIIAFSYNLTSAYPAHFRGSMDPFPGGIPSSGCIVLKITGVINIPEAGDWTFACGSDDGFKVTIGGHGMFSHSGGRSFDTSFKTLHFAKAGKYTIRLVYYNIGIASSPPDVAGLEFSMAKGSYSSFNSSSFSLVRASSSAECHDICFDANGGTGEMEAQLVVHGEDCLLPANTFTRDGYTFQGWATSADGDVVYADGAEITVDSDMTLYAVWERDGYQVRLHGNLYAEGEGNVVDQRFTFGEEQALMENPFKENVFVPGNISGEFLGWSIGTPEFDWNDGVEWWMDGKRLKLEEEDLLDYARTGAATVEVGIPILHLYAIWRSKVTVDIHGADGEELSPSVLKDHVKFKLGYDGEWRNGGETVVVPPGWHTLQVGVDPGYEAYLSGKWQLFGGGAEMSGEESGVCQFKISSEGGPDNVPLEVRMEWSSARGAVIFQCTDAMTSEQRSAWPDFPLFDEEKVQITLTSAEGGGHGVKMKIGQREKLPVGKYTMDVKYAETAGSMRLEYWQAECPYYITIEDGKTLDIPLKFFPFGCEGNYSFALLTFEGNEENVEMWFLYKGEGYYCFSENRLPKKPKPADGLIWHWYKGKDRTKEIDNFQTLRTVVMRWLNAEPPERRQTFELDCVPAKDAVTVSGVAVTHAWLEENAGEALAANGGDYEAASLAAAANGMQVWECYVTGLDPANPGEVFKTTLHRADGTWEVEPVNGKREGRVYTVYGKKTMTDDEDWTDLTDVEDVQADGWRFFRLRVEMAE